MPTAWQMCRSRYCAFSGKLEKQQVSSSRDPRDKSADYPLTEINNLSWSDRGCKPLAELGAFALLIRMNGQL